MLNTSKECVANNKQIKEKYKELLAQAKELLEKITPPCEWCRYDGEFRCQACADSFYEGFNIRNYP